MKYMLLINAEELDPAGAAAQRLGRTTEAMTAYERVLELAGTEPERALARDRLAEIQQTEAHGDGI